MYLSSHLYLIIGILVLAFVIAVLYRKFVFPKLDARKRKINYIVGAVAIVIGIAIGIGAVFF